MVSFLGDFAILFLVIASFLLIYGWRAGWFTSGLLDQASGKSDDRTQTPARKPVSDKLQKSHGQRASRAASSSPSQGEEPKRGEQSKSSFARWARMDRGTAPDDRSSAVTSTDRATSDTPPHWDEVPTDTNPASPITSSSAQARVDTATGLAPGGAEPAAFETGELATSPITAAMVTAENAGSERAPGDRSQVDDPDRSVHPAVKAAAREAAVKAALKVFPDYWAVDLINARPGWMIFDVRDFLGPSSTVFRYEIPGATQQGELPLYPAADVRALERQNTLIATSRRKVIKARWSKNRADR